MVNYLINKLLGKVFGTVIKILIDFIIAPIVNIVYIVFVTSISFYVYNASTLLLSVTDFLFDMFRMFAGVSEGLYFNNLQSGLTAFVNNEDGVVSNDLLIQLVTSEQVLEAFGGVLTAGLFLVMVCSFMAIIKQEFNMEKANNKGQVLAAALKSMINMILVPAVCIMGMFLANQVLKLIDTATGGNDNITISGVIFSAATIDAYYGDELDYMISLASPLDSGLNGALGAVLSNIMEEVFELIDEDYPDKTNETFDKVKKTILKIFGFKTPKIMIEDANTLYVDGNVVINGKADGLTRPQIADCENQVSAFKQYMSTMYTYRDFHYINSHAKNSGDDDVKKKYFDGVSFAGYYAKTAGSTLGRDEKVQLYKTDSDGNPTGSPVQTIDIAMHSQIESTYTIDLSGNYYSYRVYYNAYQVTGDFHVARINYFIILMACGAVIKALFGATLGLMMRVYQGAALFIIMPAVIGISPLDEGGAFNRWKSQFISQVVGAYSSILAVNLFLMLCGWFMNINLAYMPANMVEQSLNLADITYLTVSFLLNNNMISSIFKMLFIVTGALMIQDFSKLLADILGLFDVMGEGNSMANQIKNELGKTLGVMAGVAAGGAAMNMKAFGGLGKMMSKAPSKFMANRNADKGNFLSMKGLGDKHKGIRDAAGNIDPSKARKYNKEVRKAMKSADWKQFRKEEKAKRKDRAKEQKALDKLFGSDKKAEKQFRKRVRKAAKLHANTQIGFSPFNFKAKRNLIEANEEAILATMGQDGIDAGINAQSNYNAAKKALNQFDFAHSGEDMPPLTDEEVKERERLQKEYDAAQKELTDSTAGVPAILDDKSDNVNQEQLNAQQALLDAQNAEKMELKTNMMWGLGSLKDMLPGMKTLKEMKAREDKGREKMKKNNETMEKFVGLLEEMEKDLLKEKEKANHKDYLAEAARIIGQKLQSAINASIQQTKVQMEEDMKGYAKLIESAYNAKQQSTIDAYIAALESKGYSVDVAQARDYGQLKITSQMNPISIDMSKLQDCKSEKEVLDLFKKSMASMNSSSEKLLAKVVNDAIKNFKASADGK